MMGVNRPPLQRARPVKTRALPLARSLWQAIREVQEPQLIAQTIGLQDDYTKIMPSKPIFWIVSCTANKFYYMAMGQY